MNVYQLTRLFVCVLPYFLVSLQDPTAYPYHFQDDPYLSPRTSAEFVRLKHTELHIDITLLSCVIFFISVFILKLIICHIQRPLGCLILTHCEFLMIICKFLSVFHFVSVILGVNFDQVLCECGTDLVCH